MVEISTSILGVEKENSIKTDKPIPVKNIE